ncbi:MAG: hypothetical protein WCE63_03635 [Acidobacteriaceae bacterium]
MSTYHQRFQESIASWSEHTDKFAMCGFELSQARDLISQIGARTEIFLKTVLLPGLSPKLEFDSCINALKREGVNKSDRDTLHRLRTLYNDNKHNAACVPSVLELQELIPAISEVFRRFAQQNIGLLNADAVSRYHQVFWIAAWDNLIGGDTEVHAIAPSRSAWPPDLDLAYVDMSSWDQVKSSLSAIGVLRDGQGCIPDSVLRSFSEEPDFLDALVFEGAYRDLIATLASYERREDLIPGLRREDNAPSMMQAFTLALIDVSLHANNLSTVEELGIAIADRAVNSYAVPKGYNLLCYMATNFAEMLLGVQEANRNQLAGPIWISKEDFEREEPFAQSKHYYLPVLVSANNTIFFELPN